MEFKWGSQKPQINKYGKGGWSFKLNHSLVKERVLFVNKHCSPGKGIWMYRTGFYTLSDLTTTACVHVRCSLHLSVATWQIVRWHKSKGDKKIERPDKSPAEFWWTERAVRGLNFTKVCFPPLFLDESLRKIILFALTQMKTFFVLSPDAFKNENYCGPNFFLRGWIFRRTGRKVLQRVGTISFSLKGERALSFHMFNNDDDLRFGLFLLNFSMEVCVVGPAPASLWKALQRLAYTR
jgi:hypothetical protein